ncbi:hypothetical protein V8D89_011215 [Ganoderma adspersum]
MPRYTSIRARSKRKREPSPEDDKAANKRPRRAAALKAEAKMQVKEEDDDTISPILAPTVVKPEPGLKLNSDAKVEAKPEPRPPEAKVSKASAKRGRRMPTKQTPAAGPSTVLPSQPGQEAAAAQDAAPIPSESPTQTKKKGRNKGPSKAELKKARAEKWKKWCEARKWIRQYDPGYQQKVGDVVAHRTDAMAYYRFKDYEIDTIPYVAFENQHNQNSFGRAYNNANLRTVVSRKLAYLAGLDEQLDPETKEAEFLRAGWKLFETATREQNGNTRKSLKLWRIVPRRVPYQSSFHHHGSMKSRPFGSWSTRVYEDGAYIGEQLHFQFDPEADDFADLDGDYEEFWPRDADWAWELGGFCSCCDCDL